MLGRPGNRFAPNLCGCRVQSAESRRAEQNRFTSAKKLSEGERGLEGCSGEPQTHNPLYKEPDGTADNRRVFTGGKRHSRSHIFLELQRMNGPLCASGQATI